MTWFDYHTEVFDLISGELALLEFQMKVKFSHSLQDAFGTFFVEGGVGGVDEEIIHIDDKPSFSNHVVEGVIHEALEGSGGVGEPEEHYGRFKESFMGNEGCFRLVTILDSYVVVPPSDIKLGEDLGILQLVYEVGDEGKRVGIANGVFVNVAVVLAGAESAILLLDEEEGGGLRRIGRSYLSGGKVFI